MEQLGLPLFRAMNAPRQKKNLNFNLTVEQTKQLFAIVLPVHLRGAFLSAFNNPPIQGSKSKETMVPGSKLAMSHLAACWGVDCFRQTNLHDALSAQTQFFFSAVLQRRHDGNLRPQNRHLLETTCHPYRCLHKSDARAEFDYLFETLIIYCPSTQTFVCQGCPRTRKDFLSTVPLPASWLKMSQLEDIVSVGRGSFIRHVTSPFYILPSFQVTPVPRKASLFCIQVSDNHPSAPLLPPDIGLPSGSATLADRKRIYCKLLGEQNRSNRVGCRKYVKGVFHKDISGAYVPPLGENCDFIVSCLNETGQHNGVLGTIQTRNLKQESAFLDSCLQFGRTMGPGNCRQNAGDGGKMVTVGDLPNLPEITRNFRKSKSLQQSTFELNTTALGVLYRYFPAVAAHIAHFEHCFGCPRDELGGVLGMLHRLVGSKNLVSSSHVDVLDGTVSLVVWVETIPGSAQNCYLVFPNIQVVVEGVVYNGLAIPITHGVAVSWDARFLRHATSCSIVPAGNDVYGIFFGSPQRDITSKQSIDFN